MKLIAHGGEKMKRKILRAMKRGPVKASDFTKDGFTFEAAIIIGKLIQSGKCHMHVRKSRKGEMHARVFPVYALGKLPESFVWPLVNPIITTFRCINHKGVSNGKS